MSGRSLGLMLAAVVGCSSGQSQTEPVGPGPDQQVDVPPKTDQCAVLIAVINGGLLHVDNEAAKAKAAGQPELIAMKVAMNRVADELEQTILADPNLLRLGGFYVGVLRVQGGLLEELSVGLGRADQALVEKKQGDLEKVQTQEAAIIDEINKECPGGLKPMAPADPSQAPPASPPPAGPAAPAPVPTTR